MAQTPRNRGAGRTRSKPEATLPAVAVDGDPLARTDDPLASPGEATPTSPVSMTGAEGIEPMALPEPPRLAGEPDASKPDAIADRDAPGERAPPVEAVAPPPSRPSLRLPVAAGAVAGAIFGALVALIVPSLKGRSQTGDINTLNQRVASLEKALGGADAARIQTMNDSLLDHQKRLDALREAMTAMNASTTTTLSALRQSMATSAAEAVAPFGARLQKLEQSDQALTGSLKTVSSGQAANIGASLLSATQALASGFERGAPLANELRAVESLARKPELLGPLKAYASTGAPTISALGTRLAALRPVIIAGEAAPAGASALDRLAASAGSLVKIRPVGEQAGTDIASVYSRIESSVQRSDLAAALRESAALPPKAAATAKPWLDEVRARISARAAIEGLENDALAIITESRK